jgi:hypothetical protein
VHMKKRQGMADYVGITDLPDIDDIAPIMHQVAGC